ncbi:AraC-like transcriptional regulator QhpR [Solimonas flava]|uniref:AraC-like transcriptional regulator QhpR n=1 Tax=Solimonas flava TaxID=415849 RepID=UPI0003F680B4|nr:AraC family transcriptional regulator [Solimonas flava]
MQARWNDAGATIRAGALTGIRAALAPRGLQPEPLCERRGVDPALLDNADARLPVGRYVDLLEDAARVSGNAALGLRLGYTQPLSSIGPGAVRMGRARSFGEAVRILIADLPLHQDGVRIDLEVDGRWASLSYSIRHLHGIEYAQDAELSIGKMLSAARRLGPSADWAPAQVHFEHPAPADPSAQRRLFGAPVHFSQPRNALIFDRALLDAPMRGAEGLGAGEAAGAVLPCTESAPDLVAALKGRILRALPQGGVTIEAIAEQLALSERTLQRRLQEAGLNFQQLVEQLRYETACRYLQQGHLPLTEIGYLLGYSEPSAFSRAFRRWSGASPLAYRRQLS